MDPTLAQLLQRLFADEQELDRLREQNRELQAAYTNLKNQLEANGAVSTELR